MHQLSRMNLLVPVLTALQKGVASGLSRPNVTARPARSLRMSPTMYAAAADSTGSLPCCCSCCGGSSALKRNGV